MTDTKLLPCPFCGCEVQEIRGFDYVRIYGTHGINCPFLDDDPIITEAKEWNARASLPPLIQPLHENGDLIAAQATIAQQAQMIEHLRGGPTPLYSSVDMTTAAADGFRDGAASHLRLIEECRSYLQCVVDHSMSRNNAEALADELLDQITKSIGGAWEWRTTADSKSAASAAHRT